MPAHEITDDAGYRLWVFSNSGGYVLNTGADPVNGPAMLHRANCMHIEDHKSGKLAGAASRKFVANSKSELRELVKKLGRAKFPNWETCNSCGS